MTQEDKELLLKDLSARLPYDTIISVNDGKYRKDVKLHPHYIFDWDADRWDAKPYLRHPSDMTEEEVKNLVKIRISRYGSSSDYNNIISIDRISTFDGNSWSAWLHFKTEGGDIRQTCFIVGRVNWETTLAEIDYLNSIHVDYRDMIKNGLAYRAPEGMYDIK